MTVCVGGGGGVLLLVVVTVVVRLYLPLLSRSLPALPPWVVGESEEERE